MYCQTNDIGGSRLSFFWWYTDNVPVNATLTVLGPLMKVEHMVQKT